MKSANPPARCRARLAFLGASMVGGLLLGACSSGGDGGSTTTGGTAPQGTSGPELVEVEYGRLVDVYGLARTGDVLSLALYRADVVIGTDIADERPSGSGLSDREVRYDFLAVDPETLTSRLLIPREIGTQEFDGLFDSLDDNLKKVTTAKFGQDVAVRPYTVVPRNAALEVTFSRSLGIDEDFFVARDANGNVIGVRNTEAVQLLSITGDPTDDDDRGDFQVITTRIVPRGEKLIVDPVFLGDEGVQYGTRNNASGLPGSADQLGANIRLAIAVDGPLRIPGVKYDAGSAFLGKNNDERLSVIRDFRSGNQDDDSTDIANGFIRDAEPPRIVGALPFLLVNVNDLDSRTQRVRVFKNGRSHEIDRGDILRVVDQSTGDSVLTEVTEEPEADAGKPEVQYVNVAVRRVEGLEELDPERLPGYPADPESAAGQDWLRRFAPRAVLVAEFTFRRVDPVTGLPSGDDPTNFLTFSPEPLPQVAGYDPFPGQPSLPNVNVSPFASAIVRFTKPVNLQTVRAFDTFFFATRDVLSQEAQDRFKADYGLSTEQFTTEKFVTPHLVDARVFDESGSQTTLRLQPVKGFYLDEEMRQILPPDFLDGTAAGVGAPQGPATPADPHGNLAGSGFSRGTVLASRLPYFLHLVGGLDGIKDLAGNPLDFQSEGDVAEELTIPFALDGRKRSNGRPFFEDNLVVSIVRRFAATDEDEQPSLYRLADPNEYQFPMPDTFGAVTYTSAGRLVARPATRVTKVVDNVNQQPPPAQNTFLRWCPETFDNEGTRASNTAAVAFGQGIQNPLNPYGARLQTLWREIDMSLSRSDPFDFNLDVEQMYWAPVTTASIFFDIFDEVSLFLGHSEYRPEPCVGQFSALPNFPNSGLKPQFDLNFAHNQLATGTGTTPNPAEFPSPLAAYEGVQFTINPSDTLLEPNGINRFLPLPRFQKPYFVWRDEAVEVQGGMTQQGDDTDGTGGTYSPYILSPWLAGRCTPQIDNNGVITVVSGYWDNRTNFHLGSNATDNFTGGLLGSIALPLLADFQTFCDQPDLPLGAGFIANGFNGWQISLTVQSSASPNFRVFSAGTPANGCIGPDSAAWSSARGQPPLNVQGDNSLYWTMADFLKRQTVATVGFVEILNPHRMNARGVGDVDPRLGPFFPGGTPAGVRPTFEWHFEPALDALPNGTAIVPEFRAASQVTAGTWAFPPPGPQGGTAGSYAGAGQPNPCFALNPYVSGDAHIKKYDRRSFGGQPRNFWSFYYTEHITDYTTSINDVMRPDFLSQFSGPNSNDNLTPTNVVYFNWRFVMSSNVDATPPVSPSVESFAISYRFERTP